MLAGCASDAPQLETEHSYRVEWIGERPLIDRSHLTITFAADGRAHGNAGCNGLVRRLYAQGSGAQLRPSRQHSQAARPALMEQDNASSLP